MLKGIVRAFNESEEVSLTIRTATIDNTPFVFTSYANTLDTSMVWIDINLEDRLIEVIQPYIRGEFEVEWLQPLT